MFNLMSLSRNPHCRKNVSFVFFKNILLTYLYPSEYTTLLVNYKAIIKMTKPSDTKDTVVTTLRIKKNVITLVDKERAKFSAPRSTWITQAVVEKLEKLGYEID